MSNTIKCNIVLGTINTICISSSNAFERQQFVWGSLLCLICMYITVNIEPSNTEITLLLQMYCRYTGTGNTLSWHLIPSLVTILIGNYGVVPFWQANRHTDGQTVIRQQTDGQYTDRHYIPVWKPRCSRFIFRRSKVKTRSSNSLNWYTFFSVHVIKTQG
jgi:hypothetical protein